MPNTDKHVSYKQTYNTMLRYRFALIIISVLITVCIAFIFYFFAFNIPHKVPLAIFAAILYIGIVIMIVKEINTGDINYRNFLSIFMPMSHYISKDDKRITTRFKKRFKSDSDVYEMIEQKFKGRVYYDGYNFIFIKKKDLTYFIIGV